jgi:hypothetical protein
MAHLLRAFNNGPATSTLKEARPSEQTQTNDAGTAETPTKTTATTGTSTMGWKTKEGEKRGDCSDPAKQGKKGIDTSRRGREGGILFKHALARAPSTVAGAAAGAATTRMKSTAREPPY